MTQEAVDTIDSIATYAKNKKIAHLSTSNSKFEGNYIQVGKKNLVNFGSCSYLGLEFDKRLKKGAISAIEKYGTQFSSSRAYLSLGMYEELESKLNQVFGGYTVVTPTTTLGHIAAIPVLIEREDLVIIDQQVHNSVQTAVQLVKSEGAKVEILRHNRIDLLEDRIVKNKHKYNKIWYLADGVYSMYGDRVPIDKIYNLLNKYDNFHFYVDDAHAMSCFGERGQGYALDGRGIHDKMVVATSLNKAFASGGGVLVFPDKKMAQKVRNCGGPLITSGPMQPSALGAAIAAVNIHLSGEICKIQDELSEKVRYTHLLLEKLQLPNLAEKESSIFFIAVGLPKIGYNLVQRLMKEGHYLNLGIFPAVPIKNTGVRFTITRLHTFSQIEKMISDMAHHFQLALEEENYSINQIYKAFKIKSQHELSVEKEIQEVISPLEFTVETSNTIIDVNKNCWNDTIGKDGIVDWNNMNLLENSFMTNQKTEENWAFNYLTIKDNNGQVILRTFTTSGLTKDDMLSNSDISDGIEGVRKKKPYYYTSTFLSIGSMITEGDHLFLNQHHPASSKAMSILYSWLDDLQKKYSSNTLMIRDLKMDDSNMDDLMVDNGFFKTEMPINYSLNIKDWNLSESFRSTLSKRSKRHFKEDVERFEKNFVIDSSNQTKPSEIEELYELYKNVHAKSLEINTFKLPKKFFLNIAENKSWDIIKLSLKTEPDKAVGVVFAYKGQSSYSGVIVGLDYKLNREFNVYRQTIYQLILSAKKQGFDKVDFGFSAGIEKKKFGAVGHSSCAYMQVKDNFKFESLMSDSFRKEVENEVPQLN